MASAHTIIIDGIWARPSRWNPLREQIESELGPAEIWQYDSTGRVGFEELGARLISRIRELDCRVNLVGYSMGGLIARAAHLVDPSLPIHRAVFMNSPHAGSLLAYFLPLEAVRQMRPTSEFMKRVKSDAWPTPALCIYNPLDTMVVPGSSTRLPGATEVVCCAIPIHLWPIWSKSLRDRVVKFLKAGETQWR